MYQYSNSLIRQFPSAVTGNAAVGIQATVYVGETGALASLFESNGTTPKSNPVTTDDKGFYSFSLADGNYRIVFSSIQFATLLISVLDGAAVREEFDDLVASNAAFRNEQQAAYDSFVLSQGWDQVGTFAAGFTFTSPNQVGQDSSGNWWRWNGAFPKVVTAGTLPTSDANYKLVGDGVLRGDLSETNSSVLVGGETAGDIAAALNKSDIRLFGVPSLDVGDLIQAALNATGAAYIPTGTWSHIGAVVGMSDNQHIYFAGSTINKSGTVYDVFINASGRKNFSITGQCTYNGTRSSSLDVGDEKFIRIDGGRAYRISGLTAYKCRSHGFEFRNGATGGGVRGERGQVSNIAAYECDIGIETTAAAAAEYICFNNVNTCNNRVGIKDGAGNTIFNGGNCSDNDEIGFWLVGNYLNNAHGIVSSMNINHNGTYNIQCDDVTNGHTFNGCHFYGNALNSGTGAIFLNNSKGIVISGGDIDCWIYNFDGAGSGKNYIKGVYMPGGYGDVATNDASNLRPKDLIILDCQGPGAYQAGVAISDPSECYVAAQRNAASTQALTSGALTDLVFNTVQANGDRRRAYNAATGVFTVPVGQDGQYKITATLVFQGTALNAAASFAELILPSTGKRLITLSDNGGVLLTGSVTTDVYLSASQTVNMKAAITGTSPVFGSSGYVCTLQITRIS